MSKLKEKFKVLCKYILRGHKATSQSYTRYLKKIGISIGKNVTFHDPSTNFIDPSRPWMIEIGNNVEITRGTIILTHGYDWAVFKHMYGEVLGSSGKVVIGNNVFIGMNSIILKGVTIGNNVIIGAGSVVSHDVPSNSVYAGVPARFISDIETYRNKRKIARIKEAKELAITYYDKYKQIPPREVFDNFFEIFENEKDINKLNPVYKRILELTGNYSKSVEYFKNLKPIYNGYSEFINKSIQQFHKHNGN